MASWRKSVDELINPNIPLNDNEALLALALEDYDLGKVLLINIG